MNNRVIEMANTVFKKVNANYVVVKSRFGDLSENEIYTQDFVNEYSTQNVNVVIL